MRATGPIVVLAYLLAAAAHRDPTAARLTPNNRVRSGTATRPVYASDPRVEVSIELTDEPQKLAEFLQQLEKTCGVVLLSQPGLRDKSVRFVTSSGQPLRDVLAQLATFVSAQWYRIAGRYVLARDVRLVPMSAMTNEEASELIGKAAAGIFDRVTPEQWARLESGHRLGYDDLTPEQRSLGGDYAAAARARRLTMERATVPSEREIRVELLPVPSNGGEREVRIELLGPYGRMGGVYRPVSRFGRST